MLYQSHFKSVVSIGVNNRKLLSYIHFLLCQLLEKGFISKSAVPVELMITTMMTTEDFKTEVTDKT